MCTVTKPAMRSAAVQSLDANSSQIPFDLKTQKMDPGWVQEDQCGSHLQPRVPDGGVEGPEGSQLCAGLDVGQTSLCT